MSPGGFADDRCWGTALSLSAFQTPSGTLGTRAECVPTSWRRSEASSQWLPVTTAAASPVFPLRCLHLSDTDLHYPISMALLAQHMGQHGFRQGGGRAVTRASDSTRLNLTTMPARGFAQGS
ncbi:hypothetical protein BGZ60DRAFT_532897 [Tricladium varicosporioides]|nr:hypothetical protein BGZ60DRAFT_532897 [Hymenoscyphus varicosporioides]